MLDTARNDYKATYDKLMKFEQDHCTVLAPSAPWPTFKKDHVFPIHCVNVRLVRRKTYAISTWRARRRM